MSIQQFKAEQISKLIAIKQRFRNNERVAEIIDNHLIPKLQSLKTHGLPDYVFTLYLASREFNVFEDLIPSEQEVEQLIKEKGKFYYFKVKYLSRLMRLRKELKQKYPDKIDRVENIVFELAPKLVNLRRHMLTDYLFTVTLACREFAEFCNLVPSEQEIKQLFVVPYEE
ncbi:MAG: hypothetical protein LM583_10890 [Desulfurococcaceae archaeon]|nr:hypothetical protein [Desulfurococcaceae archaeon]